MKKIFYLLIAVILATSCTNEVKEIISKYPDGSPKVVVFYKKSGDKKIKIREIGYYQDQKEMYSGKYKDEQRNGTWVYLYQNGKTFAKAEFVNNLDAKGWEIVDPIGNTFMDKDYKMNVTGMYNNGAPYQVDFKKAIDKEVNEYFFYPDYKLQMIGKSLEKQREGKWTYYYENGNKWSEGYFKKGLHDSIVNTWYENGQAQHEGFYKDGKEAGTWKYYNQQGRMEKEVDYNKVNSDKLAKK